MPLLRYLKVDVWFCNCAVWELQLGKSKLSFGLCTMRGCDPACSAAVMEIVCNKHGLFLHQVQLKPVAAIR